MKISILAVVAYLAPAFAAPLDFVLSEDKGVKSDEGNLSSSSNSLGVDLGYARYEGFYNTATGVNEWRGIRYAAAPIGKLRWQAPKEPPTDRTSIIKATQILNQCPQSFFSNGVPGFAVQFLDISPGSEDCLFLSVFSPTNAKNLPVLVYIHGGGYGLGNANQSLAEIVKANNGGFVAVGIQYRLGAFGFLSSSEVNKFGTINAGIKDQTAALKWVQKYIRQFGGDPTRVTISGESAGAGSVMLQALGNGGTFGTSLFKNLIVASPYLPPQHDYNAPPPTALYKSFATNAGCANPAAPTTTFQCLVSKDTVTLQMAAAEGSASGPYGTWAFIPVIDGTFTRERPTEQLLKRKINGVNILSGSNANEGSLFVPYNITTQDKLVDFVKLYFPSFTTTDVEKLLTYYPGSGTADDPNAARYATLGFKGPTANQVSSLATGYQQIAANIYAETTFVCPSYWLSEAYSLSGRTAFMYQYSIAPSLHASDVSAYLGPATASQGPDFVKAFMTIWGNFVIRNNPSISAVIAAGGAPVIENPTTNWPRFTSSSPNQINLNQTGGMIVETTGLSFLTETVNTTEYRGPGLRNHFTLANAYTWEGNRGSRCDFWRSVRARVPQ